MSPMGHGFYHILPRTAHQSEALYCTTVCSQCIKGWCRGDWWILQEKGLRLNCLLIDVTWMYVVVACEDDNDNDVDIPLVSVYYAWLRFLTSPNVFTILQKTETCQKDRCVVVRSLVGKIREKQRFGVSFEIVEFSNANS